LNQNYNNAAEVDELLDSTKLFVSNIKPSEWYEANMIMPKGSAFPGKVSYNLTPYWREVVDCMASDSPVKKIAVMKGGQEGFSAMVLTPTVGYTIAENPGNILFLVGNDNLVEPAVVKLDHMIDNTGIRHMIKPSIMRAKNSRTGDTNRGKEFFGGTFVAASATNHNMMRQMDIMILIADDFEAVKKSSVKDGDTRILLEQRTAAYQNKSKIIYGSTPQVKQTSNIEPIYLRGDQRRYHVPCPCCHQKIILEWEIEIQNRAGELGGITWQLDEQGKLLPDSVRYICQKCGEPFDETHKYEMNLKGEWIATSESQEDGLVSFHMSGLYAPPGMKGWTNYVVQYLEACPPGGKRDEEKYKAWRNLCLGLTYEQESEEITATDLQRNNLRKYSIGIVPEKISERDGNGKIVLLTCACDLNGTVEDARLDYEIVGWSETGASYSITHGSIGTFVPKENSMRHKEDRERWSYEHNAANSVWREFDKILTTEYKTDTERKMRILISGVDCGHYSTYAYTFLDKKNNKFCVGLRGDKENKFRKYGIDTGKFKTGKERANYYLLDVNLLKDDFSQLIKLRWDERNDDEQPPGFMNFPLPSDGKYLLNNYFSHFEAEQKSPVIKNGIIEAYRWQKKAGTQNHFFDVKIYNMGLKEIMMSILFKEAQIKNGTWQDYVNIILNRRG